MPGVGSSSYYLELGALQERFGDPQGAAADYQKAIELADKPALAAQGWERLARIKEGQHDGAGAIAALQKALAELEKTGGPKKAPGAAASPPAVPGLGNDIPLRLGRLLLEHGSREQAEQWFARANAEASSPWQLEEAVRQEVTAYRAAHLLDDAIAAREKILAERPNDELALRFLTLAWSVAAPAQPATPDGGARPTEGAAKIVSAYERLHALRPDDPQVRQSLIVAYERAGAYEKAIALLRAEAQPSGRAAPAGPSLGPAGQCGGLILAPPSPALGKLEEIVQLYVRAGQKEKALAETARLARGGLDGALLGVRLYRQQARPDLAKQTLAAAGKLARTQDEQRAVAVARADLLLRNGEAKELAALLEQWQKSGDPCLAGEAARRSHAMAQAPLAPPAAPASLRPAPGPRPAAGPPPGPPPPAP
jgi:tetratricopeptide (TPR) repeat protein